MDSESIDQQSSWHVVIAGGGFAGLRCALELAPHDNIQITLIDKNNYQQFHPLLYQVAASILSPDNGPSRCATSCATTTTSMSIWTK